jgi:hypothetical protein
MYIFFLGGIDELLVKCNTVYRYDTLQDGWKEMASMVYNHSKKSPQSLAIPYNNRYIFVFGPIHCEKYDIYTDSWSLIQPPSHYKGMCWSNGHTRNDNIYIFGKQVCHKSTDKCVIYSPLTDTWQERLDPLPRFCVTKSFLGKSFSLFHKKNTEYLGRFTHRKLRFSQLKRENCKERKLVSLRKHSSTRDLDRKYVHMMLLSRWARLCTEHNESLQHIPS